MKALQCLILLLSSIKVTYFLRIFDSFSFLIQMIQSVFIDLRYFLLFFLIFTYAVSIFLSILVDYDETIYAGLGFGAFFAIAFRSAVGDNEIGDYAASSNHQTLTWIVWLIIMLVGNIIFMNFIIAVVNESYENCMMTMVAQSYKVKV